MQTHRAYADADTTVTCWVRTGGAKPDFSGNALVAHVYPYGQQTATAEIAASSPEAGRVDFTVTAGSQRTPQGLYRFAIEANGAVVYDGLLEVV